MALERKFRCTFGGEFLSGGLGSVNLTLPCPGVYCVWAVLYSVTTTLLCWCMYLWPPFWHQTRHLNKALEQTRGSVLVVLVWAPPNSYGTCRTDLTRLTLLSTPAHPAWVPLSCMLPPLVLTLDNQNMPSQQLVRVGYTPSRELATPLPESLVVYQFVGGSELLGLQLEWMKQCGVIFYNCRGKSLTPKR